MPLRTALPLLTLLLATSCAGHPPTEHGSMMELRNRLGDERVARRLEAAAALGTLGGPDARRALQERLEKEEDPAVREALQQNLSKLEP